MNFNSGNLNDSQRNVLANFQQKTSAQDRVRKMGFPAFVEEVYGSLHWQSGWHYQEKIYQLLADMRNSNKRFSHLAMSAPPRHGKSKIVTIAHAAYELICDPRLHIGITACNANLAQKVFSSSVQDIVKEYIPLGNMTAKDQWNTSVGGEVCAIGVDGKFVGRGYDRIYIDDPIGSAIEAQSEDNRNKLWQWWINDIKTRREPGCKIYMIFTRWHEDDIIGRILESTDAKFWTLINFPAICEEVDATVVVDTEVVTGIDGKSIEKEIREDALGRKVGEALCPPRMPIEELIGIKSLNQQSFNSLYQGRPSMLGGNMFKRQWWRFYYTDENHIPPPVKVVDEDGQWILCAQKLLPSRENLGYAMQSWDMSFNDKKTSDFTCGLVGTGIEDEYFILDRAYGRMNFDVALEEVLRINEKWKDICTSATIEAAANGHAIISSLRGKVRNINPISARGKKTARCQAVLPFVKSGQIYLPHPTECEWTESFIAELSAFPNGKHDDQADAFSQLIDNYTRYNYNGNGYEADLSADEIEELRNEVEYAAALKRIME